MNNVLPPPTSFLDGSGPSLVVTALFVFLALAATALAMLCGRLIFRRKSFSFFSILLYAVLGGLMGIFMHLYGTAYLQAKADKSAGSLLQMFSLFSFFTFANMLAVPLVVMALKSRNRKIKELEEELRKKT
jgi:hypothetical protein